MISMNSEVRVPLPLLLLLFSEPEEPQEDGSHQWLTTIHICPHTAQWSVVLHLLEGLGVVV